MFKSTERKKMNCVRKYLNTAETIWTDDHFNGKYKMFCDELSERWIKRIRIKIKYGISVNETELEMIELLEEED